MRTYPNPMSNHRAGVCPVCKDPCGRLKYCCQTCAETAYYATTCGRDCECDSLAAHEDAQAEAEKDFLRDPGPPPAHMSDDGVARARTAMAERRAQLGMPTEAELHVEDMARARRVAAAAGRTNKESA